MTTPTEPMPDFLSEPSKINTEISITGKWIPTKKGGLFRKSAEAKEMLKEWEDIHAGAQAAPGVLSTEINHAVGEDSVLVHHVFENDEALINYFSTTATQHMGALLKVAKPDTHLVRGANISQAVRDAISAKHVSAVFGEYLFGYVRDDYKRPDQETAINVTAKWICKPSDSSRLDELKYWWQRVGTDAHSIEEGLHRFEVYQAAGEDALIIHEVFEDTVVLKFHLTKGTTKIYKKEIDQVADADRYFFRGPVSWLIHTYSTFLHLPATYSSLGSNFARPGGSMSDGSFE